MCICTKELVCIYIFRSLSEAQKFILRATTKKILGQEEIVLIPFWLFWSTIKMHENKAHVKITGYCIWEIFCAEFFSW